MSPRIEAIPAFQDNYIWVIHDDHYAVAVDPGEADGLLAWLDEHDLRLAGLLLTHHHPDHIGGVDAVRDRHAVPAWGPADARMPTGVQAVGENDTVEVPELELAFRVLEVPGHTRSHIAFHEPERQWLFSGDTLFSVGCGRTFEGTAQEMQASLDKLAALPGDTRMYCGHEYTRANCRFALQIEPDNAELVARAEAVDALREAGGITLPSTLGQERATNPFLRTREASVVRAALEHGGGTATDPASVFRVIRAWKDSD